MQLREGQEFGDVRDPRNPFTKLMREKPEEYKAKFGFNNTANYHFSLHDIPEMFGIAWSELEQLDATKDLLVLTQEVSEVLLSTI